MVVLLSLMVIGYLMVIAATYDEANPYAFLDFSTEMGKQSMWFVIALVTLACIMVIDWTFWNTFAFPIYGIAQFFLLMVVFFGSVKNGSKSWLALGPASFQPSEVAKLGTCLAIASFLSFNKNDLRDNKTLLTVLALMFTPVVLIMLQPDPGSAMVFFSFFMLLFRKGLDSIYYILTFTAIGICILSFIIGPFYIMVFSLLIAFGINLFNLRSDGTSLSIVAAAAIATYLCYIGEFETGVWLVPLIANIGGIIYAYRLKNTRFLNLLVPIALACILISYTTDYAVTNVLKPHQQDRINAWLRPHLCDPKGSLYNVLNSKMAISSGGFDGKGFLKGEMTKLNYVPEQPTDFIFSTVGEEQGFVGGLSVILLFTILIIQSIRIAERSRLEFFKNYAYGVAGILFIHFFINIGMTIGITPVIGIPLPFVSKGGTSLAVFTVLVGIMIKMDASKNRT
jgi:rod shape determining protein RodA